MAVTVIVEDGTVVANANSYISVADATTYFTNRPNTDWTAASADEKAAALIKATDYMVQKYRLKWRGIRVNFDQVLDWPRAGVITEDFYSPETAPRPTIFTGLAYEYPTNVVPLEVKNACCELAARSLASSDPLNADLSRGGAVKREKVGTLEVEYFGNAVPYTVYQAIDDLLRPFFKSTGNRLQRT